LQKKSGVVKSSNPVYSEEVIKFVKTADEYCSLIEQTENTALKQWIDKIHRILPELYLGAVNLPSLSPSFEELNQRNVTEEQYATLHKMMLVKLGEFDAFEEIFDENRIEAENAVGESIAENLADIYQDIKDFVLLFEDGSYEVMYEAIWEVRQSFEHYWGQKLVNTLRAVHNLNYSESELEESTYKPEESTDLNDIDTSSWIISRRQEDFQNEV
jgi:hypothetical protein